MRTLLRLSPRRHSARARHRLAAPQACGASLRRSSPLSPHKQKSSRTWRDSFVIWAREDSNLHGLPHVVLSHARIPFRHSPDIASIPVKCPPGRDRTYDRLHKRELLYQLSYGWKLKSKQPTRNKLQQFPLIFNVPGVGIEPTWSFDPRILSPLRIPFRHPGNCLHEARAGIEPANDGFADRSVTTSPPCHPSYSNGTSLFDKASRSNRFFSPTSSLKSNVGRTRRFSLCFFT